MLYPYSNVVLAMKKILYTTISALLLVVGCTKERYITGEHEVSAEVSTENVSEQDVLAANLYDAEVDDQAIESYVTEQLDADVELLLLTLPYGAETQVCALCTQKGYTALSKVDGARSYVIAGKGEMQAVDTDMPQILVAEYYSTYFVVGALAEGVEQVECTARVEQVEQLIASTVTNRNYAGNARWIMALDMNCVAELDKVKYNMPYVNTEEDETLLLPLYAWQFAAHQPLLDLNVVDCMGVQFSLYPFQSNEMRHDFIYASLKAWQIMQPMTIDYQPSYLAVSLAQLQQYEDEDSGDVSTELKPACYPVLFTLKMEEK